MDGMARGDYGPLYRSFADDVTWRVIGSTKFSGVLTGKSAIVERRMQPFAALMRAPPEIEAHRYICEGDWVAVEAEGRGITRSGKPYDSSYCMVFRVQDGLIVEFTEYFDTDASVAAFGRM